MEIAARQPALFDPLERDTAPARSTDPATSHAAAKMPFRRLSQRHLLLEEYGKVGGLTDEEAAMAADILRGCPWKRCSELREQLMIAPMGLTRKSTMGADQQVCRITGKGLATLEQLAKS